MRKWRETPVPTCSRGSLMQREDTQIIDRICRRRSVHNEIGSASGLGSSPLCGVPDALRRHPKSAAIQEEPIRHN
ncbi:hypothetical protein E2553_41705 [Paraburkholderia dipogonis]|uniref:Uncharacterized protein n=1 Tax=Paraburkholderia dipogonis TaxID=1211383 RepID=A0A4Y8MKD6_9BURK|nr:hypothetical protein [Paraburkholderia dipogonis]TFE37878.1 hypothetical protein E2553_41705 [Paraburkholderia dipogonis]